MPVDMKKYPTNWKEIRGRIQQRAGDKCEFCGVANHAVGARDKQGRWHDENTIHHMNSDCDYAMFGDFPKIIKIVCTTMHLDHDINNNTDDNLKFACQRCHNRYDMDMRQQHAAETRHKKKVERTGQIEMQLG